MDNNPPLTFYILEGLKAHYLKRKNYRKSRNIKAIFRRLAKKYNFEKTDKFYISMFNVMICGEQPPECPMHNNHEWWKR